MRSSVEHRLSDVREDTPGLGSFSMDGGDFDDLLQPLPEENEDLPGPGVICKSQACLCMHACILVCFFIHAAPSLELCRDSSGPAVHLDNLRKIDA